MIRNDDTILHIRKYLSGIVEILFVSLVYLHILALGKVEI